MNNKKIIVGILNCFNNKDKRYALQNTLIKELNNYNIKYYFIIGHNKDLEIKEDIIYLNCKDDYSNLSNKIGLFIKYIYENTSYEYIYKIDDDCFINVRNLLKLNISYPFIGHFISKNEYSNTWGDKLNYDNKIVDKEISFNFFGGGYGYLLNRKCMQTIINNLKLLSEHYLEDIGICKILNNNFEIKKLYYPICKYKYNKQIYNDVLLFSDLSVDDIYNIYEKISTNIKDKELNIIQFIKKFNIEQIYLSKSLSNCKNTILKDIEYKNYNNLNSNTLFIGLYSQEDYKYLFNHKGKKFIFWGGNDSIINNIIKKKLILNLRTINIENHITTNKSVKDNLHNLEIDCILLSENKICNTKSKKILCTRLTGGLGNQLLMSLNLLSLSIDYNYDCYIDDYFKHETADSYKKYMFFKNINSKNLNQLENLKIFEENEYKYNKVYLDNYSYIIKGYFQSYKYFWHNIEKIKNIINIDYDKLNILNEQMNKYGKILSIHIRLTDYIKYSDIYGKFSIKYYEKALSYFDLSHYTIMIFSDDIDLAKEKLSSLNLNFIDANIISEDDEDQFLMLCLSDVKIGTNSSFSLLSSYFNEIYKFKKDAKYVFPSKWFYDKGPMFDINDLIPIDNNNYIKINIDNINRSTLNNSILIILKKNVSILFYIKVLSRYNFLNYKLYIYKNDNDNINLLNDIFPSLNIINENINEIISNFDIIISGDDNIINSFDYTKKDIFVYTSNKKNINLIDNVIYVNCLSLDIHFCDHILYNLDDDKHYIYYDYKCITLFELKSNIDISDTFYVNNKILNLLKIKKNDIVNFKNIELKKILNDGYYSKNGLIKNNEKFYFILDNKIQEINITELQKQMNRKIDKILYEDYDDISNFNSVTKIELHFTILILSYNNEKYVSKNLNSVLTQKYSNYDIIFINCQSTDNTLKIAKNITKDIDNFYLFNNVKRCYQTENFLLGSQCAKTGSIIVSLDGDDWFYNNNVLNILNNVYLSNRCLMTYGSYVEYPYKEARWVWKNNSEFIRNGTFRKYKKAISHLRTWKKELILNIRINDVLYNKNFPKMAGDISVLPYMIEIANDRVCFIRDSLYVYNTINMISDEKTNIKLQEDTANYFYSKKSYNMIYNYSKIIDYSFNIKIPVTMNTLLRNYITIDLMLTNLFNFINDNEINNYNKIHILHPIKYDLLKVPNPVLDQNIYIQYNLKKNMNILLQFIKKNRKLELVNKKQTEFQLNRNYNHILYEYLKIYTLNNNINFNKVIFESNIIKREGKINFIIPVKNRKENLEALINNLLSVIKYDNIDVIITVVEYNDILHKNFCKINSINYISIISKLYNFNKCLLANLCYKLYDKLKIKYKYIIFHDVDCLIKNNFFNNIFKLDFNNKFIQPYKKNRVLETTEELANKIRLNEININSINENTKGIIVSDPGASGGSIFIKKELFENVGGFDYELFSEYSCEDLMFFSKLKVNYELECCNFENSNIIHLWHSSTINTSNYGKNILYYIFLMLNKEYKNKYLLLKKDLLLRKI
jgi:hypothetical protein